MTTSIDVWPGGARYQTATVYDGIGRVIGTSRPATLDESPGGWTEYGYDDAVRHLKSISRPGQGVERWEFPNLFEVDHYDANNNLDQAFVDADQRRLTTIEFIGKNRGISTAFGYGGLGGPLGLPTSATRTDNSGHNRVVEIEYDIRGPQIATTDLAAGTGTRYADTDAFGQVWRTRDAVETRTFSYDAARRLTSTTNDAGDGESFVWDSAVNGRGRLASATRLPDNVVRRYEYDQFGRVQLRLVTIPGVTTDEQIGYTIREHYDSEGRPFFTEYPDATGMPDEEFTVVRTYGAQFMTSVSMNDAEVWSLPVASPLTVEEEFGDASRTKATFDPLTGQLANLTTTTPLGAPDSIDYTYFPNGDLRTRTRGGRTEITPLFWHYREAMTYDGLRRLSHWGYLGGSTALERRVAARGERRRRSARPAESVGPALRITRVMRSGPCAGATRSRSRNPTLRPGTRASRADLDITGHYVSSAGPAALKGSASRYGWERRERLAPCRRRRR